MELVAIVVSHLPPDIIATIDSIGLYTGLVGIIAIAIAIVNCVKKINATKKKYDTTIINSYNDELRDINHIRDIDNKISDISKLFEAMTLKEDMNNKSLNDSLNQMNSKLNEVSKRLELNDDKTDKINKVLSDEVSERIKIDNELRDVLSMLVEGDIHNIQQTMIDAHDKYVIKKEPLDPRTYQLLSELYIRYTKKEHQNSFVERLWNDINELDFKDTHSKPSEDPYIPHIQTRNIFKNDFTEKSS